MNFGTSPLSKSVCFLILNNFFKNGSRGQTTMLMRRASKFCVEPRSPFSEISHQESRTIGKSPNIVSWPECQPEFPSDGGGRVPTTLDLWRSPGPTCPGTKYPVRGIPHFDYLECTSPSPELKLKNIVTQFSAGHTAADTDGMQHYSCEPVRSPSKAESAGVNCR